MIFRIVSVWILSSIFIAGYSGQERTEQRMTVAGTLTQVVAIGGETTGWAIRFDKETKIQNKLLGSIEVAGDVSDLKKFRNKHVEVTGKLVIRHGVERSEWLLLEIETMNETPPSQKDASSRRAQE